jgi:hypothetical protein
MNFKEFKKEALSIVKEGKRAVDLYVTHPLAKKKNNLKEAFIGNAEGIELDRRQLQLKRLKFNDAIGRFVYQGIQTEEEWEELFDEVEKITHIETQKVLEEEERNRREEERKQKKRIEYLKKQTPPKLSKKEIIEKRKMRKTEKRNEKLKRALEAGALVAERSLSKVVWDIAHNKVKVVSGKLDYRSYQILNCASDKIAQNEWFSKILFPNIAPNKNKTINNESLLVFISATEFKKYINDQTISNKNIIKIFEDLPKATLKGEVIIPLYYPEYQWVRVGCYMDNICGVAIAWETKSFEKYRSKKKLRGKGSGEEEPVFALIFSNAYGQAFFRNAQKREAGQLINQRIYKLKPDAQELFQAVRWNEGSPIILNIEEISRAVGWVWPSQDIYDRVERCQKLLDILYENNFINKPVLRGKNIEERSWLFFISKGRGVLTPEHKLKFIKPTK